MKVSTIMAVTAIVITVVSAGCRYDKAAKGAEGAGDDAATASDITTSESEVQEGNIAGASENRFEDMYARCNDVSFAPVYFGFDSTVVAQEELGKIDAVSDHLKGNETRVVVVEGNCDERGSNEYNLSLGENRSIIIRNYLIQNGIDVSRIQTRSFGEEKPANPGHDEGAWAQNRRGEFGIYDSAKRK